MNGSSSSIILYSDEPIVHGSCLFRLRRQVDDLFLNYTVDFERVLRRASRESFKRAICLCWLPGTSVRKTGGKYGEKKSYFLSRAYFSERMSYVASTPHAGQYVQSV